MKKYVILICYAFILCSCEEVADNGSSSPNTITHSPNPQDLEKTGQTMAFSSFNTLIKEGDKLGAKWTKSPILVALQFAGTSMSSRTKNITAESLSGGESFDKILVIIEDEGLLDDSIKGSMTILRLEQTELGWQINKATRVWKCWDGRGHTSYGVEPCG